MATSPSSSSSAVLDASVLIRALVDLQPEARGWVDRVVSGADRAIWPAHLYAEVANVLARHVRTGRMNPARASLAFEAVRRVRAHVGQPKALDAALAIALERGLSVYDAAYVVLAEALDAPLVTADRRLAEATDKAVLLPG